VETGFLLLPATACIAILGATGEGTLTTEGTGHAALLVAGGVVTALPLMLFGAAAIRVPLSTIGLLQYLAPVMQFLIGVLVRGEPMPVTRLAGFALVWAALVLFTYDAVHAARASRALAPVA
jgi:chloramphenicol-sensitive protein RarD